MPQRYIVRATADSAALQDFVTSIAAEPAVRLVQTIGPQAQPHTAVIETDDATATRLKQRFSETSQLIIEPDRPLSLFGGEQAGQERK